MNHFNFSALSAAATRAFAFVFAWVMLALLVGCASPSSYQPDDPTVRYFISDPYKQQITLAGLAYDKVFLDQQSVCSSGYKWEPISFAIQQPLKFELSQPHPASGQWTYRFRFERCGESIIYNVQFHGERGQVPKLVAMPPGTSRANAQLTYDLRKPLAVVAMQAGANLTCKSIKVTNTEVTVQPFDLDVGGQTFKGTWQERWSANACGQKFDANFCLMPHPKGGTTWTLGVCTRPGSST